MNLERPLWVPTRIYIPGNEQDLLTTLPFGGPMFRKGDTFTWDNTEREELKGRWKVLKVEWGLDSLGGWCQTLVVEKVL